MSSQRPLTILYNPQEIGGNLIEVAVDMIKTEREGIFSRWFHSDYQTDLFVWVDTKQRIVKQQLTSFGLVAEWNAGKGVRTGMVVEVEDDRPYKASEVIYYDPLIEWRALQQAQDIVGAMENIPQSLRDRLLVNFSETQRVKVNSKWHWLPSINSRVRGLWKQVKKVLFRS